jgi:SAM-dependent methyltransferase
VPCARGGEWSRTGGAPATFAGPNGPLASPSGSCSVRPLVRLRELVSDAPMRSRSAETDSRKVVLHRSLSRVKFVLAGRLSPKAYWYLMGRLRAVKAVTSQCATLTHSMESGTLEADLLERLGVLTKDAQTLQIGSGLGRVERALATRVAQCYGCDVSASMVKKASDLTPLPNVKFVHTAGTDLSLWQDASLDVVYSFLVFQHLPRSQVELYVKESWRVLRPGGHLVFQLMMDEEGLTSEPPEDHPYGLRYYRRSQVQLMLGINGFDAVRSLEMTGSPDLDTPDGDLLWVAQRP